MVDKLGDFVGVGGGSRAVDIARHTDFGPKYGYFFGGGNAQFDLGWRSLENFNLDILTDYDGLTATPANNEH
jgi:hypothetical protein